MNLGLTRHSLSKEEAEVLCNKYQFLIGESFDINLTQSIPIKHVTVAPFDDINKYIFIVEYRSCLDILAALKIYEGDLYDVIVIAEVISNKTYIKYKDLDRYLEEKISKK